MRTLFVSMLMAGLLGGCASVTAPTSDIAMPVPATLGATAVAGSATLPAGAEPADLAWRELVTEPRLQAAIELALANNRDLRVAVLNIDAARAEYRISDAARGPTLNASAGGSASRTAADLSNSGEPAISRQVSVSLGVASWELDLWGRLGQLKDAALASYLSTEQTQRSVQATLVADVASAWLTLSADQQILALTQQTLASRQQSLALTQRRKALGAASALELATTQASAETARGDLATARAQVESDLNALRLLLGTEPPAALLPATEAGSQDNTASALLAVPADLPSSVLLRRPDVRAAELDLKAAQANVAAARAAMFPTLTLTASAGTASTGLSGLFNAGNGIWSFAPAIRLPIFDGGSSQAALDGATASRGIKLATYEKTIQSAFRDVSDALAQRASLAERTASQQALVSAYESSLRLTTERQRVGAESALAVLDAQRLLYAAQQNLINLHLIEQNNRITLFKTLGGT